jgi:hypothetical protein
VLRATDERAGVLERRGLLGEVERAWTNAPEPNRHRHAAMAGAGGVIRGETTVLPSKCFDCGTGVLQALSKQLRRDVKGFGALRA